MQSDFVSVMRCFNCWGFNHIAKYCGKEERCNRCAGHHNTKQCKDTKKRCVNCSHKIETFNDKTIKADHEALDKECPSYLKKVEEERRKIQSDEE